MKPAARMVSRIGVLSGASVGIGFLLSTIPNVEGMSAVAFVSGYLLGCLGGIAVGAIGILIFSILNPLGPPLPHVLAAQVAGMSFFGIFGGIWKSLSNKPYIAITSAGLIGGVLTALYSILTDFAFALSIGKSRDPLPVILAGTPFSALHILSNVAIFIGVASFLMRRKMKS